MQSVGKRLGPAARGGSEWPSLPMNEPIVPTAINSVMNAVVIEKVDENNGKPAFGPIEMIVGLKSSGND